MNQQAFATVILRIVGLTYFYTALTTFVSGGIYLQVANYKEISGGEDISLIVLLYSIIGIKSFSA